MKDLVIVGNGGHSKVLRDIVLREAQFRIVAVVDDAFEEAYMKDHKLHVPFMGVEPIRRTFPDAKWIIAVGTNEIRKKIFKRLAIPLTSYATLIDPSAVISPSAKIGFGTVIMPNAVINAQAVIGEHSIINSGAVIEHDCIVGNYTHISPQAVLTGGVKIMNGVHIGANASVIPGKVVGQWAVIGAGSTVIKSIPAYITAIGSPAVMKQKGGSKVEKYPS
ncbi:acetyltransferase [Alkalicoccus daliensis]|uniref:Sugar O-acyltransferase, sialic acid O-acetyltransferase NeuD family n=1 Tax=Alkalicoccus daliensis TaxID=745820 RepID=A0A1G9ZKM5_9BACI|nr:acetyltransferase [Alkalicoccus daliensis]SDN21830.1 sugar O-acyltransferase, sialic acid O-acetyltransferase NeuD family [Alkalicoccus daliensis]